MRVGTFGAHRIDTVDIAPYFTGNLRQRKAVAQQVDSACRRLGFLVIANHGISDLLISQMRTVAAGFFDLPEATKLRYRSRAGGPGFQPPEATALGRTRGDDAPRDLKEGFRTLPPHRGPRTAGAEEWFEDNIWPQEVPAYASAAVAYFHAMAGLAGSLLRIMASALDLPEDFFESKIDQHISRLSALYYPAAVSELLPDQFGAGAHTDYGSLTILHKEPTVQGLQIQHADGTWFDVTTPPGSFIVNIGDLLAEWTNDRWVSTVHRVVHQPSPTGNISLAFFHQPNHDAVIEPMATCVDTGHPPRYLPVTSGSHLRNKLDLQEGRAAELNGPSTPTQERPAT